MSKQNNLNPVLIIPGLGGSIIYNNWNYPDNEWSTIKNEIGNYSYLCSQKSSPNENPLWVSTKGAMPEFMGSNCWRYRVEPIYNKINGGFRNKNGINAETWILDPINPDGSINLTNEFGGVDGINILLKMDGHDIPTSMAYMFYYLLQNMSKIGYIAKKNVFGAPYDFRRITSKYYSNYYFNALKLMIEYSYNNNDNNSITVISHSLGCNVFKRFLSEYIPDLLGSNETIWKDKYIKLWIPISPPLGGSPKSLRSVISGDDEGMGMICKIYGNTCNNWYQIIERNLSGLVWLLPDKQLFSGYNILSENNKQTVSPLNIDGLRIITSEIDDINIANSYEDEVIDILKTAYNPPLVNCSVIIGLASPTEISYMYNQIIPHVNIDPIVFKENSDFYDNLIKNTQETTDIQKEILSNENNTTNMIGDNTVPWIGLRVPKLWLNNTITDKSHKYYGLYGSQQNGKYSTNIKEFIGFQYDHKNMLNEQDVINYIISTIENQNITGKNPTEKNSTEKNKNITEKNPTEKTKNITEKNPTEKTKNITKKHTKKQKKSPLKIIIIIALIFLIISIITLLKIKFD